MLLLIAIPLIMRPTLVTKPEHILSFFRYWKTPKSLIRNLFLQSFSEELICVVNAIPFAEIYTPWDYKINCRCKFFHFLDVTTSIFRKLLFLLSLLKSSKSKLENRCKNTLSKSSGQLHFFFKSLTNGDIAGSSFKL